MTASSNPNPLAIALPGAGTSFAVQEQEIGSAQIGSTACKPGFLQLASISLTAAQIIAMYATPQLLIAAPPTGMSLVVEQVMIRFVAGATQFTGGGVVAPQIGNTVHGGGTLVSATLPAATINSASSSDTQLDDTGANVTLTQATGLYISNATAAFATGNGTATVYVWYRYL